MRLPLDLGPPRLQTGEELDRHATWLELFFDLVFVVAVAELAHDLATDVTPDRLVLFVALFVPVFLVWMNFSYYADLFGETGLDRIGMFLAMFGVGALATTLHDALAGSLTNFVVAYLLLRVLLVALYARAWQANPAVRAFVGRYVTLYGVAAGLWAVALLVEGTPRFALLGLGLVIEVATPAVTYYTVANPPQQVSHMPERFGLFTILVLGEVVVAVVAGLGDTEWSVPAVAAASAAFVVALGVWSLYFAAVRETTISDILRSEEFDFLAGMGYTYGHFGVTLGITAAGIGSLLAILAAATGEPLAVLDRLVLGGGLAVYLLGTTVTHGSVRAIGTRAVGARLAVAGGVVAAATLVTSPLLLVVGAAVVLAALALTEAPTAGPERVSPAD